MRTEQYLQFDAKTLARLIATRDISPVEVIEASLSRLDVVGPFLNAFDSVDADGARRAAEQAERRLLSGARCGPLHVVQLCAARNQDFLMRAVDRGLAFPPTVG